LFERRLAPRRIVEQLESERAPVEVVHGGQRRNPVPPHRRLLVGARVAQPALDGVVRSVGGCGALDAAHDPERAAEPRRIGLEPEHLGHRDVGVLGERLHHPELRLEVGLEEHGVRLRRDACHQMMHTRRSVFVVPGGVEEDGFVREPRAGGDLEVVDGHLGQPGDVGEPCAQPVDGLIRVA
jgi:hypothetical protein